MSCKPHISYTYIHRNAKRMNLLRKINYWIPWEHVLDLEESTTMWQLVKRYVSPCGILKPKQTACLLLQRREELLKLIRTQKQPIFKLYTYKSSHRHKLGPDKFTLSLALMSFLCCAS